MPDVDLIKPEELVLKDAEGNDRKFILSNFPAVQGREIVAQYPTSGLPKVGDYGLNRELMLKLMSYVAVDLGGTLQRLETEALINNHVPDWEMLAKLEMAMMEKNCSFFRDGRSSDFLENMAQIFLSKITEISTRLLEQSSPANPQPLTNSEQSTT